MAFVSTTLLRNGLPASDRERHVLIGKLLHYGRHELMPGNSTDRRQDTPAEPILANLVSAHVRVRGNHGHHRLSKLTLVFQTARTYRLLSGAFP